MCFPTRDSVQSHCSHTAQERTSAGNTSFLALALHRACAFISQEGEIIIGKKKKSFTQAASFTSGFYFCLLPAGRAGQGRGVWPFQQLRTRHALSCVRRGHLGQRQSEGHCHCTGSPPRICSASLCSKYSRAHRPSPARSSPAQGLQLCSTHTCLTSAPHSNRSSGTRTPTLGVTDHSITQRAGLQGTLKVTPSQLLPRCRSL